MSTDTDRSPRTRPSPLHTSQGFRMIVPSPPQAGDGPTETNWPNMLRAAAGASAPPAAGGAGRRPSALGAAGTLTRLTAEQRLELERPPGAGGHFLERHPHVHADVVAPAGLARLPPAAEERLQPTQAAEVAHEHV